MHFKAEGLFVVYLKFDKFDRAFCPAPDFGQQVALILVDNTFIIHWADVSS